MKKELFDELTSSIKEAGEIRRSNRTPARTAKVDPLNVKLIREQMQLSQQKFAAMIGVSPSTVQNWEQGRRKPEGPARALLRVVARHPEAVLDSLHCT